MARVGGIITIKVDGNQLQAKGNFSYNLGIPKREAVIGADAVHGFKDTPQVAFIEGQTTDAYAIDMKKLVKTTKATVTLDLANGKSIVIRDAYYAAEGKGETEEGNIELRFESAQEAEELK